MTDTFAYVGATLAVLVFPAALAIWLFGLAGFGFYAVLKGLLLAVLFVWLFLFLAPSAMFAD
ncbi:MAG: hypothetical protein ACK5JT_04425 [Hyphomicrobiaceae bacterium]